MNYGIIRITEYMKKDLKVKEILNKTVGHLQITMTKSKAWYHTYTDYEVKILNTKTNTVIYKNSSNDQGDEINKALVFFSSLKTMKAVKEYVREPWDKY